MDKLVINEAHLWNAIQSDDIKAFNTLFNLYWERLYKTAFRYTHDRQTSEEIVHDVFLSIWTRRHQLEIVSFPAFLQTAVRYQIYNRARLVKPVVIQISDYLTPKQSVNEGELRIENEELNQELRSRLADLPKRCQEIFLLSRIQHFSNDEIAGHLGISKRTVENQITLALRHLRMSMKEIVFIAILFFIA